MKKLEVRFTRSPGDSMQVGTLAEISPLDRLVWLGTRTMGALTYHPPAGTTPMPGRPVGRGLIDHVIRRCLPLSAAVCRCLLRKKSPARLWQARRLHATHDALCRLTIK